MAELNQSIEDALGFKTSFTDEERALEKELLQRQSEILGHPIKQLTDAEKSQVDELITRLILFTQKDS